MTIGERLRDVRIAKNLTQQEASQSYGCSRQYLNGVENDHIKVSVRAIRKFAQLYGVDEKELSVYLVKGN